MLFGSVRRNFIIIIITSFVRAASCSVIIHANNSRYMLHEQQHIQQNGKLHTRIFHSRHHHHHVHHPFFPHLTRSHFILDPWYGLSCSLRPRRQSAEKKKNEKRTNFELSERLVNYLFFNFNDYGSCFFWTFFCLACSLLRSHSVWVPISEKFIVMAVRRLHGKL